MTSTDDPKLDRNTRSFLVRIWREGPKAPWRLYVRNMLEDRSRVFSNLDGLVRYLKNQIEADRDEKKNGDS